MRVIALVACLLLAVPATAAQRQQLDTLSPAQAISRAAAASPKPVRALFQFKVQSAAKTRGGYYLDTHINGEGCNYRTVAHPATYHDYSTGFRCCADAH